MGKKTMAGMLLASFILVASTVAAPSGRAPAEAASAAAVDFKGSIVVNGAALLLAQPAYAVKGVTMVPLTPIAKALGAKVDTGKDAEGRSYAKLTRGDKSATITVGVAKMSANGRTMGLDVAPELRNGSIMVPVRAISEALGTIVSWDGIAGAVRIDDPKQLPVIGTQKKLDELMQEIQSNSGIFYARGVTVVSEQMMKSIPQNAAGAVATEAASVDMGASAEDAGGGSEGSADYSKTNVQVQGVDEADWAKTDGKFVYQISGSRVHITDISNPDKPKLAASLEYSEKDNFYPIEIYVDDNRLVVIGQHNIVLPMSSESAGAGSSGSSTPFSGAGETATSEKRIGIMPVVPMTNTVQTKVYELDDAGKPTLKRETEIEGSYISSRKIEGALYVVTNKYNYNYVYPMEKKLEDSLPAQSSADSGIEPMYGDSAVTDERKKLPLSDIRYFPNPVDSSMLLIGALDLDRPEQALQVSAYLGSGQTIYASSKHLYVSVAKPVPDGNNYRMQTHIYKFRLDQGNVLYVGEGSVPGNVLNQFSMDEHNGYFRIATTIDGWTSTGEYNSTNNVYVLDEQLKTIGKLEDLAPGERIYSARFMGSRAYMVTFRQVDPLFVLDLRSPTRPAVLGQLKIPGYSDYLHPYDDNHLIGFGKETVELPVKGGDKEATMAYYQGMKIALFDVTDVNHPKEMFKEVIGDRGTSSELLYNHKALLFSKEKGLLAFPVELMEIQDKDQIEQGGFPAYGQFVFQGAYVYGIDLKNGFALRGRITHLSQDDLAKSGQYGYNYGKSVRRILYAGNTLYTLSDSLLKANDLGSLSERGTLQYPLQPGVNDWPGGPVNDVVPVTSGPATR